MNSINLFQVNTRVWIQQWSNNNTRAKLNSIPDEYWLELKKSGFDLVWLMGIWETPKDNPRLFCFTEELMNSYDDAVNNWSNEDIIGSPFAIEKYDVSPSLGTKADLLKLKNKLNSFGLKLILDFIPNHFGALSNYVHSNPEYFLQTTIDNFNEDNFTYFKVGNKFFAHGRDPFYPAWQDTVQINYFNEEARNFMINNLLNISTLCDGLRCDMAMLALNNIFENTWNHTINDMQLQKPKTEFWEIAINKVKSVNPEFIFMAEAYWNLEENLQTLGFDFTYDKKLLDLIKYATPIEIKSHLEKEIAYQKKTVRFIENHDEERAISALGIEKSQAAAVLFSTVPGIHLFFDGQMEGFKIKLPLQLGKSPQEKINKQLITFYSTLLNILKHKIIKNGNWKLLEPLPAWENDNILSFKNLLIWQWTLDSKIMLIAINLDNNKNSCRVKLNISNYEEEVEIVDLLNNCKYLRNKTEILNQGLYIELEPFQSHIFEFKLNSIKLCVKQ